MLVVPNRNEEVCCSESCVGCDYNAFDEVAVYRCKLLNYMDIEAYRDKTKPSDCPIIQIPKELEKEFVEWLYNNKLL